MDEAKSECLADGQLDQDKVDEQLADDGMAIQRVSVLQNDEGMSVDLTSEIARETLMHLKIKLERNGQLEKFDQTLQVLQQILQNILRDPLDTKYHKLKLQNKKVLKLL